MAGRPTKLNEERTELIRQALLAGAPIGVAASRGGIAPRTYHEWEARGRAALERADHELERVDTVDAPFAQFAQTVTRARHEWELGTLGQIALTGRGRPYRETTTKSEQRIVTNVETGQPETITLTTVTTKEGVEHDWRADAWLLERRNPQVYGKVYRAEVTGPEGAAIEVTVEDLVARGEAAADELAARRERRAG